MNGASHDAANEGANDAANEGTKAPRKPNKFFLIQISPKTNERLVKVSEMTGISKAQMVDAIVGSLNQKEIIRLLKSLKIEPRRRGRLKTSIF